MEFKEIDMVIAETVEQAISQTKDFEFRLMNDDCASSIYYRDDINSEYASNELHFVRDTEEDKCYFWWNTAEGGGESDNFYVEDPKFFDKIHAYLKNQCRIKDLPALIPKTPIYDDSHPLNLIANCICKALNALPDHKAEYIYTKEEKLHQNSKTIILTIPCDWAPWDSCQLYIDLAITDNDGTTFDLVMGGGGEAVLTPEREGKFNLSFPNLFDQLDDFLGEYFEGIDVHWD